MSDLKNHAAGINDSAVALTDYVNCLLREPESPQAKPVNHEVAPPEQAGESGQIESTQFMIVVVEQRKFLIPLSQVKSVLSLEDQNEVLQLQRHGPAMGQIVREQRHIPLFDLGWLLHEQAAERAQAVILRGQHFALACDQIATISEIAGTALRQSRDQRPEHRWIQSICMDGMIPVINIPKIKELYRAFG